MAKTKLMVNQSRYAKKTKPAILGVKYSSKGTALPFYRRRLRFLRIKKS